MAPKTWQGKPRAHSAQKGQTLRQKVDAAALRRLRLLRRKSSLQDLTVTPATRTRYRYEVACVVAWCHLHEHAGLEGFEFDAALGRYVEELWKEGEPLGRASYTVAGIAFVHPGLNNALPYSWSLLRTWEKCEPPARATPFSHLRDLL